MTGRRYYTTFEASHFLGVSLPTVVNWIKASRLKAHRTPGGHRRIARDELASFIRRHGMPMPPELVEEGAAARILLLQEGAADQTAKSLQGAGYECLAVTSAFAAGLAVAEYKPDLVIFDLAAAGFDPAGALSALRASESAGRIPVVALARDDKALRRAQPAGFDELLQKPFDLEVLRRKVENALRARRAAGGRRPAAAGRRRTATAE